MRAPILFLALASASCTLDPSGGAASGKEAPPPFDSAFVAGGFQGKWAEILPENVVYYEGSKLAVRVFPHSAQGGRMLIDEHHWTDIAICSVDAEGNRTCSAGYDRAYDASYRFEDSLLVLDYRRMDQPDGPFYRAAFRGAFLDSARLLLEVSGEDPFIGNKRELVLSRESETP